MRVTLYLLRDGAKLALETLRKPHLYSERRLREPDDADIAWRLFVRTTFEHDVRWFEHVSPLLAPDDNDPIRSKSAGAVLLVQAHGRLFAVTFGLGYHALAPMIIEPDFGLRVTANSITADSVTLADARGLGKGKRNATSRLSLPGQVFALGLLTDEEWIRKFGGNVQIPGFAKSASGADVLQLNVEDFILFNLSGKLRQALDLFSSDAYKEVFPFLDYFRRETDKETVQELDQLLTTSIQDHDPDIGFASPDEFNLAADYYRLSRYGKDCWLPELRTEDVYAAIDELNAGKRPLRTVRITAYDINGDIVRDTEPLRPYIVASVERSTNNGHQHYATTAGAWFRVDQEYVELVDRYLEHNIADLTDKLQLPKWDDDDLKKLDIEGSYGEIRYNRWVSQERGYIFLDTDLYRGRAGERVEICDLLTKDKQLICVKRMDGSDKMSHLFQQGSISAQMLMTNDAYRDQLMSKLRELDPAAKFGNSSDWTVVYAIATSKPGDLKQVMYFFSRAALRQHGLAIKGSGIKVAVAKIER